MKTCPQCKYGMRPEWQKCPECGTKLEGSGASPCSPCPFCGSENIEPYFWRAKLMMTCTDCNASGPWACGWREAVDAANDKPKEEALRLWNLRANVKAQASGTE